MKPPYGFYEPPETGCTCPICGYDVDWRREPYEKIGDDIFHLICLEQEPR